MVSLLPTIDGRLFKIEGGNRLLPERLIRAANASLHQGVTVTRVHKTQDGLFTLQHRSSSADELVKVINVGTDLVCVMNLDCGFITGMLAYLVSGSLMSTASAPPRISFMLGDRLIGCAG